ncbi:MAG: hypothetical protein II156_08510, partial [Lachnospiraceae bacterium]|nr:hypothetical protein [Lachnospiraceae bacterium]
MLKKQSILIKLGIMTLPLAILAIALGIYAGVSELSTLKEAKEIYFDEVTGIVDKVLATDRDFYQAQLGSDRAHMLQLRGLTLDAKDEVENYDSNLAQVYEGLDKVKEMAEQDPYLYNDFRAAEQTDSLANMLTQVKADVDT